MEVRSLDGGYICILVNYKCKSIWWQQKMLIWHLAVDFIKSFSLSNFFVPHQFNSTKTIWTARDVTSNHYLLDYFLPRIFHPGRLESLFILPTIVNLAIGVFARHQLWHSRVNVVRAVRGDGTSALRPTLPFSDSFFTNLKKARLVSGWGDFMCSEWGHLKLDNVPFRPMRFRGGRLFSHLDVGISDLSTHLFWET